MDRSIGRYGAAVSVGIWIAFAALLLWILSEALT